MKSQGVWPGGLSTSLKLDGPTGSDTTRLGIGLSMEALPDVLPPPRA
jgi:hypothetical protein